MSVSSRYAQLCPAAAFGGGSFLVAWEAGQGSDYDIYGTRVTPQGKLLDPQGIVISRAESYQRVPAVVYGSTSFMVVWEDFRSGGERHRHIYGARVTPQGKILDPQGIAISQAANCQESPAVSFDGANFFVVWEDSRDGGFDIYGARVTPQGTVLDSQGIVISRTSAYEESPAVGFDGENYLVVWNRLGGPYDPSDIYGARVTPQGKVLDQSGIVVTRAKDCQRSPAVGFDGANFLVVWQNFHDWRWEIHGARLTPQGMMLDSSPIPISKTRSNKENLTVDFDGKSYLVAWEDNRAGDYDICGARVTSTGIVLDTSGIVVSAAAGDQQSPASGFGGANSLVVWEDKRGGKPRIYGVRVTREGALLAW
jgi:phosphoribosylformylglycinamidine (FGAM) synthase PurS component